MVIERLDRLEEKLDAKLDKAEFYKVLTLLVALGGVVAAIVNVMLRILLAIFLLIPLPVLAEEVPGEVTVNEAFDDSTYNQV